MSEQRQGFWQHALANKDNAGRRNRPDFRQPSERAAWVAHRKYWTDTRKWEEPR